jgi:hypothetical protein
VRESPVWSAEAGEGEGGGVSPHLVQVVLVVVGMLLLVVIAVTPPGR